MIYRISFRLAVYSMLTILVSVLLYHFLILFEVIPFQLTWGGKLETKSQMYRFELVSIGINSFILFLVLVKAEWIRVKFHARLLNILLWILVVLFALNTIGNVMAENNIERFIFTPITMISCVLCARLAIQK